MYKNKTLFNYWTLDLYAYIFDTLLYSIFCFPFKIKKKQLPIDLYWQHFKTHDNNNIIDRQVAEESDKNKKPKQNEIKKKWKNIKNLTKNFERVTNSLA